MASKWTENQKGAVWKKESSKGKYLSGYITIDGKQHQIVIFPNKYKKNKEHPEFIVYEPFKN
tara:strand:+ start:1165 stop:1350 length:186 start_codon:yes stop_codon:yes gene_type:complete